MTPRGFALATASLGFIIPSHAFSVPFLHRKDMIGIWKVSKKVMPPFNNPSEIYKESIGMGVGYVEEVVVRLNDDGTFDPYLAPLEDEDKEVATDLLHMLGRGGIWQYQDKDLLLASSSDNLYSKFFQIG